MKRNAEQKQKEITESWVKTAEFHGRLRVYFYVAAMVVMSQLIWMIDQSVRVMKKSSLDDVTKLTPLDMGFTSDQLDKMERARTISQIDQFEEIVDPEES